MKHAYTAVIEDCYHIDRRDITAKGLWEEGRQGRVPVCGTKFVLVVNCGECLEVRSKTRLIQRVAIIGISASIPNHATGVRWYLVCPTCCCRQYALYSTSGLAGTFGCRWCLRLVYRANTMSAANIQRQQYVARRRAEHMAQSKDREYKRRRAKRQAHHR